MKFPIFKEILSRAGALVPDRLIHYADGLLNYLSVGRWFRNRRLKIPIRLSGRMELFQHVRTLVSEPLTYLEFGVFEGKAMKRWVQLLKHPDSALHGFDSFEGLPETWGQKCDRETFNVGGRIPEVGDDRVRFHKGWFTETLPEFIREFRPQPQLIIHLDADLYSSTIFPLRQLKPWMRPGTILIFDEFFDREHEMKALSEFMDEDKVGLECVGGTRALTQVAFRVIANPGAR